MGDEMKWATIGDSFIRKSEMWEETGSKGWTHLKNHTFALKDKVLFQFLSHMYQDL